jgi:hypothetical protein
VQVLQDFRNARWGPVCLEVREVVERMRIEEEERLAKAPGKDAREKERERMVNERKRFKDDKPELTAAEADAVLKEAAERGVKVPRKKEETRPDAGAFEGW